MNPRPSLDLPPPSGTLAAMDPPDDSESDASPAENAGAAAPVPALPPDDDFEGEELGERQAGVCSLEDEYGARR